MTWITHKPGNKSYLGYHLLEICIGLYDAHKMLSGMDCSEKEPCQNGPILQRLILCRQFSTSVVCAGQVKMEGTWFSLRICSNGDIRDEVHYVFFTCMFFKNERKCYLPSFCQSKPSIYTIYKLSNSKKSWCP